MKFLFAILLGVLCASPSYAYEDPDFQNGMVYVNRFRMCKLLLGIPLDVLDGFTDKEFDLLQKCGQVFINNHNIREHWK